MKPSVREPSRHFRLSGYQSDNSSSGLPGLRSGDRPASRVPWQPVGTRSAETGRPYKVQEVTLARVSVIQYDEVFTTPLNLEFNKFLFAMYG